MATRDKEVPIYIEDEMRNSYIDYSMSVIISRALPDVRDGLKPVDGDAPAAERYTEARLTEFAEEMLRDMERDTVDMRPNYDESREEPVVLPAGVPNLLVNGSAGIAVGMATNVPPHNLREIVDAIHHVIDNPQCEVDELLSLVTGPDFPTGGIIYGRQGIQDCYRTGRGHITVRSRTEVEEIRKDRQAIIVSEIPYMVSKAEIGRASC